MLLIATLRSPWIVRRASTPRQTMAARARGRNGIATASNLGFCARTGNGKAAGRLAPTSAKEEGVCGSAIHRVRRASSAVPIMCVTFRCDRRPSSVVHDRDRHPIERAGDEQCDGNVPHRIRVQVGQGLPMVTMRPAPKRSKATPMISRISIGPKLPMAPSPYPLLVPPSDDLPPANRSVTQRRNEGKLPWRKRAGEGNHDRLSALGGTG